MSDSCETLRGHYHLYIFLSQYTVWKKQIFQKIKEYRHKMRKFFFLLKGRETVFLQNINAIKDDACKNPD